MWRLNKDEGLTSYHRVLCSDHMHLASVTSFNAFSTHGLNYSQFSGAIVMCPSIQNTYHRSFHLLFLSVLLNKAVNCQGYIVMVIDEWMSTEHQWNNTSVTYNEIWSCNVRQNFGNTSCETVYQGWLCYVTVIIACHICRSQQFATLRWHAALVNDYIPKQMWNRVSHMRLSLHR
jgi:hypothetical protein